MVKYFMKPGGINVVKLLKLIEFGKLASVLYPRTGANPVYIDNRALDGFMERFKTAGCMDLDCEACRYCHAWADKSVRIDPVWAERMRPIYADLLDEIDSGAMWEPYTQTLRRTLTNLLQRPRRKPLEPKSAEG